MLLTPFREPDESGLDARIELEEGRAALSAAVRRALVLPRLRQLGHGLHGMRAYLPFHGGGRRADGDARLTPARTRTPPRGRGPLRPGLRHGLVLHRGRGMFGLPGRDHQRRQDRLRERLEAGEVIIASMLPGDFPTSGHFIVIYGANLLGSQGIRPEQPGAQFQALELDRLRAPDRPALEHNGGGRLRSRVAGAGPDSDPGRSGRVFIADCEEFITRAARRTSARRP